MRPKWDERRGEKTYGQITVAEALRRTTDHYDPQAPRPRAVSPVPTADGGPPGQLAGHEIIRKHFEQTYEPRFKRGTAIYSAKLGREVRAAEGTWGADTELLEKLAAASNAPRDKQTGAVQWNALPQFFNSWSKAAWMDMLKDVPEEEAVEVVDQTAEEEFRQLLAGALNTLVTLGSTTTTRGGRDTQQQERRSIVDWAARFAKSGPWKGVRSYKIWSRLTPGPDGGPRLQVAIRAELFSQLPAKELAKLTPTRFARLCGTYGTGQALEDERPQGRRAVLLDDDFLHGLLSGPEAAPAAGGEGE
jgi:hypothetical protein